MKPASSISDIIVRINDVNKLTEWSPVPLGSILRVSDYAYPNWGISITDHNMDWLYSASQDAYSVEWKDTDPSLNTLVGQASTNAGLGDVNMLMNQKIGEYVFDYIQNAPSREKYVIADIGAGAGATSLAVAQRILALDFNHPLTFEFILIEPSISRLVAASDAINKLKTEMKLPYVSHDIIVRCIAGTDIGALTKLDSNSVDFAVANASLHHNSTTKHLAQISRVLKPGAPFIIGDWYDGLSQTPERIYWMLALISERGDVPFVQNVLSSIEKCEEIKAGIKTCELNEFRKYFSLTASDLRNAFMAKSAKQALADSGILKFWLEVGKIFSEKGVKSPIYVLEGHERVVARQMNLNTSRFCFDADSRSKYVELSRKMGKGDLATVMVAKKARV
ncbi:MAG: class I SAM-dependent methyltransferase [Candidatus Micrarchaeota archaeon]|nr:class I SAM-dependent methyltransferase [Candidatus Micrarchaeota archaeon]